MKEQSPAAEYSIEVVFGGGPLGLALVETLAGRGRAVRLVTRSGRADAPGGVQVVAADVSDPKRAAEAARGAVALRHSRFRWSISLNSSAS